MSISNKDLERGIQTYRKSYGVEPYQKLSSLMSKIELCISQSSNGYVTKPTQALPSSQ